MPVPMMEYAVTVKHSQFRHPPATCFFKKNSKTRKNERGGAKSIRFMPVARIGGEDSDPFLQVAVRAATLRFHETNRPDPLVIDPYAACFLSTATLHEDVGEQNLMAMDASYPSHYILATKYIDDKLLSTVSCRDELRQVVLLTDGMDTRPFRLRWPHSTLIFDISPERVFKESSQKLNGIGAEVPKSCMLLHVPFEASYLQETLCKKGFSSDRPSIWAIQGLPLLKQEALNEILLVVSSLAMKGCIFFGDLPGWLVETEVGNKVMTQERLDKLFMSYGFRVDVVDYNEVARGVHHASLLKDCNNILFVAEQLLLSDGQMQSWRTEFQRLEEEVDEEGFEEL